MTQKLQAYKIPWITVGSGGAAPGFNTGHIAAAYGEAPGYRINHIGNVELRGAVTIQLAGTAEGTRIFTLPNGYRPVNDRIFRTEFVEVYTGAGQPRYHGRIIVQGNGQVIWAGPEGDWQTVEADTDVLLDGICFEAEQ